MHLPEHAIPIADQMHHPADARRGAGLGIYTLVRFPIPDTYAMIGQDGSTRTVDKRWASGQELQQIRSSLQLTQAGMAMLLHTTANNIARYERGERQIPWASMEQARKLKPAEKKGDVL